MAKGTLASLRKSIKALPTTIAHSVAQRAAPELTRATQEAYTSNENVYGDRRPSGVNGQPLTLHRTGTTKAQLRFVANGTIVRCALGPDYTRYLIGKYGILPNGAMPADWERRLNTIVADTKVDE